MITLAASLQQSSHKVIRKGFNILQQPPPWCRADKKVLMKE